MDANGNTVQAEVTDDVVGTTEPVSDAYNFENRLVRRDKPDGSAIEVLYNGDGDRVAKSVISAAGETNTTWYLVDRNGLTGYAQVVEERQVFSGQLMPTCVYTYGLDLISQDRWDGVSSWVVSYHGYDGHGNVRLLTDDAGVVTDTYTYDAFGKLIEQQVLNATSGLLEPVSTINNSQVTINSYRYCGEQYDADLCMYFLRARYMDTERGRFWTMDTFEGRNHDPATLHKYLYVHGDPVNGWDPSGEMTLAEVLAASGISALLSATINVSVTAALQIEGKRDVSELVISGLAGAAGGFVGGGLAAIGAPAVGHSCAQSGFAIQGRRLTSETAHDPSGNGYDAEYSYDLVGNRLERLVTVGQQTLRTQYTYNDNDQLLSENSDLETAVGHVPLGRGAYVAANSSRRCVSSARRASASIGMGRTSGTSRTGCVRWRVSCARGAV